MPAGDEGKLERQAAGIARRGMLTRRLVIYMLCFLSGGAALAFEIVWTRQFVPVLGNSAYAISIVLCAFMAGLGVGSLWGGRLADKARRPLLLYAAAVAGAGLWALGVPGLLHALRAIMPAVAGAAPAASFQAAAFRFGFSLAVLFVPAALIGTTLPLLVRSCAESGQVVERRVGALYAFNTLGAAGGCLAAGVWAIDVLGIAATNQLAAATSLLVAVAAVLLGVWPAAPVVASENAACEGSASDAASAAEGKRWRYLLVVAFASGVAALACEVLWVRYLAFLSNFAYTFTVILATYLVGIGLGGLAYRGFLARLQRPEAALAIVALLLAISVPACFAMSAFIYTSGPPASVGLLVMTLLVAFVPTVLMGIAFPLICAAAVPALRLAGRRVGAVYAANTAGSVLGSLLPVFLLVPVLGVQGSLALSGLIYWLAALAVIVAAFPAARRRSAALVAGGVLCIGAVGFAALPGDLCARVLLQTNTRLGRHTEVIFFREGRTGTASVVRDRTSGMREIFINGTEEVPETFPAILCFKLLGGLGPMLHPEPTDVLMICFGGGIAGGAAAQYPAVRTLEVVDLESSVVEAARLFADLNNHLLENPKVTVLIEDGRHRIAGAQRSWPVIVCDSTHPKAGDSWVLYTREFYRAVRDHLEPGGIFVQWVPVHGNSVAEYRIIARTFQSVFPETSLWYTQGYDRTGAFEPYTLLVGFTDDFHLDLARLQEVLAQPPVAEDLAPYGLDSLVGVLESFVCGPRALQYWVGEGPVNTDDLPYTQYATRYSGWPRLTLASLAPAFEDTWRHVSALPDGVNGDALRELLALHRRANELLWAAMPRRAFNLLPNDLKMQRNRQNLAAAAVWAEDTSAFYREVPWGLRALARVAWTLPGGAPQALSLFRRALESDPDDVDALNACAVLMEGAGDYAEATRYYERAIQADPSSAEVRSNLGNLLIALGRPAEALRLLGAALEESPDLAEAHWNTGRAYEALGEGARALEAYRGATALAPYRASFRTGLARLLAEGGQTAEAERHLRTALASDPISAEAHDTLGVLMARQGRLDEALPRFAEAVRWNPGLAELRIHLGQALEGLGRYDEAAEQFAAALALEPANDAARAALARMAANGRT